VEVVVNAASGSVGLGAADAIEKIVTDYGLGVRVANAAPHQIWSWCWPATVRRASWRVWRGLRDR
jgi:hypothetical protein